MKFVVNSVFCLSSSVIPLEVRKQVLVGGDIDMNTYSDWRGRSDVIAPLCNSQISVNGCLWQR